MMRIDTKEFGRLADGRVIHLFTLSNDTGMTAKVTNYGAILTEWHVPDREGVAANVVHGFDNLEQYAGGHPAFGSTIGRFANRIAGGGFVLDGKSYSLAANNGRNHLHGGIEGFHKKVWEAEPLEVGKDQAAVQFQYMSPDGEEGYPGNLSVKVIYALTSMNALEIRYHATADQATPVNLTNHSYFNLAGKGDVLGHRVMLAARHYTPVDEELIPTGEIAPVEGTPLDFIEPRSIGERIDQLKPKPGGYDHNYVIDEQPKALPLAARVQEPGSGRVLEVFTTEPGIQLYTGNFLDGQFQGPGGIVYDRHSGLCLETQHFPDSVHHDHFPSTILRPGDVFQSKTVYQFTTAGTKS